MSLKMYVLIRSDMTEAQQAVQAGHALAQFGADWPTEFLDWQRDSNVLIYLSIDNIDRWKTILKDGNFVHSVFHEPEATTLQYSGMWQESYWHRGEADTAIAVAPEWTAQYILFKDLPLALQPKPESKRRWWK